MFGAQNGKGQGFFPALLQKFGFGGAGTPAAKAPASGTPSTEAPVQAGGFMAGVVSTLFGASHEESKPEGSCLPKETAEALKKVAESPDLGTVAAVEGKVFFTSLGTGFAGLIDNVTNGFGKVFGNIGGLLGLGSSKGDDQAIGLFSLATNLMGAFAGGKGGSATYKGAYGQATGGIIHGPGSGTSDSIPTYVKGAGGQTSPLYVSNGESILTAKATAALGSDFINAVNCGRMLNARTGAIVTDQASLSRSTPAVSAPGSQSGSQSGGTSVYQVRVEPAQMRMRMGDWLDQQILNERARR